MIQLVQLTNQRGTLLGAPGSNIVLKRIMQVLSWWV
jgi:hypothetical protein